MCLCIFLIIISLFTLYLYLSLFSEEYKKANERTTEAVGEGSARANTRVNAIVDLLPSGFKVHNMLDVGCAGKLQLKKLFL